MMSLRDYDPCAVCEWCERRGKCPFATKKMCPTHELIGWLKEELRQQKDLIPVEFYAEVLREKGWHGELKRTDITKI